MVDRVAEIREAIWWCEEHRSAGSEPIDGYAICWYYANTAALSPLTKLEPCRLVERFLLDSGALIIRRDENGEWPDWATPYPPLVKVLDSLERRARLASSQGVEP